MNLTNVIACVIILMSCCVLVKRVEEKYTFIKFRNGRFLVTLMCKVLKVHRSFYHDWLQDPQCQRKEGRRTSAWLR